MSVPSDPPARETCLAAIAILPPGYQLFQAANNTAVMADTPEALRRTSVSRRQAWLQDYVALILDRDVRDIANRSGDQ